MTKPDPVSMVEFEKVVLANAKEGTAGLERPRNSSEGTCKALGRPGPSKKVTEVLVKNFSNTMKKTR